MIVWRCVAGLVLPVVSKDHIAFIIFFLDLLILEEGRATFLLSV
jgi:hypothetical protein